MKNFLVPLDLSPISEHVLATAAQLAKPMDAKLWLVHVAAPEPDFVGFEVGPGSVREMRADELRKEHVELQATAARLKADGVNCEALLVQGPTTSTILGMVAKLKADLIIMGSHGHGALYKAFVGSISEQVLTESTIPVVIIPKLTKD